MAANMILRPDNRFLGFSINDFSTYGGQPDPGVAAPGAPSGTPITFAGTPDSSGGATAQGQGEAARPATPTAIPAEYTGSEALGASYSAIADSAANLNPAIPHVDQAAAVPNPMGSSTPPEFLTASIPPAHPQPPADPGHEGVFASLDSLAVAPLAQGGVLTQTPIALVQDLGATSSFALHALGGALGGIIATTHGATAGVGTPVDNTVHGVTSAVDGNVPGLADTAHAAVAGADSLVDHVIGAATNASGSIAPALDTVGLVATPLAAGTSQAAHDIVSAVSATLPAATSAMSDAAPDATFGGTNPTDGVMTVVNLVTADNVFDLREAGSDHSADAGSGSAIDQLIGAQPETALLGETAHHDDASTTHHDDSLLHLGGI